MLNTDLRVRPPPPVSSTVQADPVAVPAKDHNDAKDASWKLATLVQELSHKDRTNSVPAAYDDDAIPDGKFVLRVGGTL